MTAEELYQSYRVIEQFENELFELIGDDIDFDKTGADEYDNSLEIYSSEWPEYPWEPPKELRSRIKEAFGFSKIFWYFTEPHCQRTTEVYVNVSQVCRGIWLCR